MKPKFNRTSRLFLALSALTGALSAPAAFAATETFNTAGTFNWVCPANVNWVQVECWGGGAGGSGTKTTTATNTSQNGGGGGGGAYARRAAVPVTPGASYTITIPAAAVSNDIVGNGNALFVNGSSVTFTGNSGISVTANGGGEAEMPIQVLLTPRQVGPLGQEAQVWAMSHLPVVLALRAIRVQAVLADPGVAVPAMPMLDRRLFQPPVPLLPLPEPPLRAPVASLVAVPVAQGVLEETRTRALVPPVQPLAVAVAAGKIKEQTPGSAALAAGARSPLPMTIPPS